MSSALDMLWNLAHDIRKLLSTLKREGSLILEWMQWACEHTTSSGELPGGPDVISGYLVTSVCRQKWQPRTRVCGDLYLFLTQFLQNRSSVTTKDLQLCNRNVCTVQASSLPGLFQLCWHDTKEGAIRAQRTDSSLPGAGAESRGWERESALYLAA